MVWSVSSTLVLTRRDRSLSFTNIKRNEHQYAEGQGFYHLKSFCLAFAFVQDVNEDECVDYSTKMQCIMWEKKQKRVTKNARLSMA